jgi:hypothetical protein
VEVTGTVAEWNDQDAEVAGDGFGLLVDPNYMHLVNSVPGSSGRLHCETYPWQGPDGGGQLNRNDPWYLPVKPQNQPFTVIQPDGSTRPLAIHDHIRLRGRLLVENGHPQNDSMRGLLRIGQVFLELHPIDYTQIRLVESPSAADVVHDMVILAAPLYEMVYTGQWAANEVAGVADHLFIGDQGPPLVHDTVTATVSILAPSPPPASVDPNTAQVHFREMLFHNGTGQPLASLRSIVPISGGIEITATVSVPRDHSYPPVSIGDINAPAHNVGVLLIAYDVSWQALGRLWHTVRNSDGTWQPLGDVFGQIANPGPVRAVAAASHEPGQVQFMFCTDDGHLWHTIHNSDGTWLPLGDVFGQIANPGMVRAVAGASPNAGEAEFLLTA